MYYKILGKDLNMHKNENYFSHCNTQQRGTDRIAMQQRFTADRTKSLSRSINNMRYVVYHHQML